jgi:2'-5' RNA ligase
MTLHFLGQVDPGHLNALRDLGEEVAREPFALVLDEIGYWRKPQVLWAAPSSVPGELRDLHARLGAGLNRIGLPTETREYRPHVTLARKVRGEPAVRPLAPLTWPATELTLVESRTGDAPVYHPIGRWPLI